jgi:hypothetical protein
MKSIHFDGPHLGDAPTDRTLDAALERERRRWTSTTRARQPHVNNVLIVADELDCSAIHLNVWADVVVDDLLYALDYCVRLVRFGHYIRSANRIGLYARSVPDGKDRQRFSTDQAAQSTVAIARNCRKGIQARSVHTKTTLAHRLDRVPVSSRTADRSMSVAS